MFYFYVKVITWESQHYPVVADVNKKNKKIKESGSLKVENKIKT